MDASRWIRATGAAGLVASLWACQAPPVPEAGESELWRTVHGEKPTSAAASPSPAVPQTEPQGEPQGEWKGEVAFSEMEIDLGDVKRGEEASHTFTLTNKTDRVLHVKSVRGS